MRLCIAGCVRMCAIFFSYGLCSLGYVWLNSSFIVKGWIWWWVIIYSWKQYKSIYEEAAWSPEVVGRTVLTSGWTMRNDAWRWQLSDLSRVLKIVRGRHGGKWLTGDRCIFIITPGWVWWRLGLRRETDGGSWSGRWTTNDSLSIMMRFNVDATLMYSSLS